MAWFPSFHCGVEVQAAVAAGFQVRFFRVGADLSPDLAYLDEHLSHTPGPVTVIHYFGHVSQDFQKVSTLCSRHGVPLIEDACHGPIGPEWGSQEAENGRIVTVSFRKVLGTPDGGALRLSREGIERCLDGSNPVVPAPKRRAIRPLWNYLVMKAGGGGDPEEGLEGLSDSDGEMTSDVADREYGRDMSLFSAAWVRSSDQGWVRRQRRANWRAFAELVEGVAGLDQPFPDLGEKDVPLSFAIRVNGRDRLAAELLRSGIDSYVFGKHPHWALPRGEFPEAQGLRRGIIGLPVHQSLERSEIERMAEFLRCHLPLSVPDGVPPSDLGNGSP